MFTGIVEEVGLVTNIRKVSNQSFQFEIGAKKVMEDVHLGDSIAINGVCLTVSHFTRDMLQFEVMPETVKSTSLQSLTIGSKVNLERSMAANGRFGGHFVSGHVDGIGKIIKKEKKENAIYYEIEIPSGRRNFFMLKGSVAVDGISLTIFEVGEKSFRISLIPHTASNTILGEKSLGDIVNIECDMLAKYVHNMLAKQNPIQDGKMNEEFLKINGFY